MLPMFPPPERTKAFTRLTLVERHAPGLCNGRNRFAGACVTPAFEPIAGRGRTAADGPKLPAAKGVPHGRLVLTPLPLAVRAHPSGELTSTRQRLTGRHTIRLICWVGATRQPS